MTARAFVFLVTANCPTRIEARRLKCSILHFVSREEIVVWCDWNIRPVRPIEVLVNAALDGFDVAASKHPVRDCLYDEARVCERLKYANPLDLSRQVAAYRSTVPDHDGLWELGVMFWRRNRKTIDFCSDWSNHINEYTVRDQISFPYLVKKHGLKVNTLPHLFRGPGTPFRIDESVRFGK